MLTSQWANDGCFSPDGSQIIIDRVHRWDVEWRHYRGGQNTPLVIVNLETQTEKLLPNESTIDIQPLWLKNSIYFLSDRDWTSNIWSYTPETGELKQVTRFTGSDIKWLGGFGNNLVYVCDGYIHMLEINSNVSRQLGIIINADFP